MTTLTQEPERSEPHRHTRPPAAFGPRQLVGNLPAAVRKLDPRVMIKNPVMFVVEVGAAVGTGFTIADPGLFGWLIVGWLWFTVIFANLAEAVAEGRGKAQAATLRATKTETTARRIVARQGQSDPAKTSDGTGDGGDRQRSPDEVKQGKVKQGKVTQDEIQIVAAAELRPGDRVIVEAGETIPADGDVVLGVASVDESAITGESAPVIRESGGDRSSVTGGTTVLSDRIVVRVTAAPGAGFVDRMIAMVEGAARQKTPNEIALNILLASLTLIFVLAVVTLQPFSIYSGRPQSIIVLIALLVCLIPTTIGALLSSVGIAGMDRLVQRNVLATSGRAVEAAGDVDVLLLDKTGTITYGNRHAIALHPADGVGVDELAEAAQLSSLADETPEGRSIVTLCVESYQRPRIATGELPSAAYVAFTAETRMSGIDLPDGRQIRKGAPGSLLTWAATGGGTSGSTIGGAVERIAAQGGTPLAVAVSGGSADRRTRVLGVIELADVLKPQMAARFAELRQMGIRTVMITGDNPITARAIAEQAGVDDFLAEATPEDKLDLIRRTQQGGQLVAMTGDGTNDAPALAQADVGVAMNTATAAAKEAGNMVDLDSDPTKLIEIVAIGKQLLITRGALTTFSIANDVAKYFAIIPAMFMTIFPGLNALNIMRLASPQSAILSAVIFNALIIIALIPLSLRGVKYRALKPAAMLRRNALVFGVGGLIVPFVGIKLIDLAVSLIPGIG